MEYDTKEQFYQAATELHRLMKVYYEEMDREGAGFLANPLPKSVRNSGFSHSLISH